MVSVSWSAQRVWAESVFLLGSERLFVGSLWFKPTVLNRPDFRYCSTCVDYHKYTHLSVMQSRLFYLPIILIYNWGSSRAKLIILILKRRDQKLTQRTSGAPTSGTRMDGAAQNANFICSYDGEDSTCWISGTKWVVKDEGRIEEYACACGWFSAGWKGECCLWVGPCD